MPGNASQQYEPDILAFAPHVVATLTHAPLHLVHLLCSLTPFLHMQTNAATEHIVMQTQRFNMAIPCWALPSPSPAGLFYIMSMFALWPVGFWKWPAVTVSMIILMENSKSSNLCCNKSSCNCLSFIPGLIDTVSIMLCRVLRMTLDCYSYGGSLYHGDQCLLWISGVLNIIFLSHLSASLLQKDRHLMKNCDSMQNELIFMA